MKIENIILKIYNKVKDLFRSNFGSTKGAERILKIFISLFYATDHYSYLKDFKVPTIISIIIFAFIIYLILSIISFFGKYLIILLQRTKPINLTVYILLFIGVKYFLDNSLNLYLKDWQSYLLLFCVCAILIIFAKSFISLFKNKRNLALIFFLPSFCLVFLGIYFYSFPGFQRSALKLAEFKKDKVVERATAYESKEIFYKGPEVSLNSYVSYGGLTKKVRDFYFKKKLNQVEVKGKVYLPKNQKEAPLLFVVHGNHRMTTKNYLGYDYLGKYLSQRGVAVVSVDMNMLNSFYKYSLKNENDARAVLLLENIKYLLSENRNENSKFYKAFDSENIALMGHSRGGEAICIANNFNKLNKNPDNGNIRFNYGFNIKGLIAVAPTFGQYEPCDRELKLWNVNYLTIAGTNDCDVTSFEGQMQYDNIGISPNSDKFKTAVYVGYANHGNFNSLWGDFDLQPPEGLDINRKELLNQLSQKRILSIYTYNFLENIFGKSFNRDLFKYGPYNYKDFPKTTYYSRYKDSTYENICDFEEDTNLQSASTFGDYIDFSNFSDIYEGANSYGEDKGKNNCVFLSTNDKSRYQIFLRNIPQKRQFLVFDLENFEEINDYDGFKIKISDMVGESASLNIKDYFPAYPPTKVYLYKSDHVFDDYKNYSAPISLRIDLEDFKNNNPLINLEEISNIEFDFDKSIGQISLDNIGFAN